MPRKETRGTGITAYEITMHDVREEGFEKAFDRSADNWNRAIKEGGGIFGAVSQPALRACEQILANAKGEEIEHSPEEFARLVARYIEIAKARIRDGNADLAARHAWDAGVTWAQARMKWAWEDDALRGEKVAGGMRNRAHATNARHKTLREKRFVIMGRLVPKVGVDKAAAHCEAEGLGPWTAVKKQWNRQRKKRDT